jgi:hypothetical protein
MSKQLGRQQLVFQGPLYQNGYGVGGYFKKFFRWIVPIAEKHLLPHLKSGAKEIGKHIIDASSNIARDVVKGRNINESTDEHINKAIDNLQQMAESKLSGSGIKRRAILFEKNKVKKKKYKDIFTK